MTQASSPALEGSVWKMLSRGSQATRIEDQKFSFILPYLGFTSFHHTFLLWRPKKTWLGKERLFPFPSKPLGGGARFFFFFRLLTLLLFLFVLHGHFTHIFFPMYIRLWKAFAAAAAVLMSKVFASVFITATIICKLTVARGADSSSGMKYICRKPAGPKGVKLLTLVSFTLWHEQMN